MRTVIALVVLVGLLVVGCTTPEATIDLPSSTETPEESRAAVPTGQVSQMGIKNNQFFPTTKKTFFLKTP